MPLQTPIDTPSDVLGSFLIYKELSQFETALSERGQVRPCTVPEVTFKDHLIVLPLAGQLRTHHSSDGLIVEKHLCRVGNVAIYPAGTSAQCHIETKDDYRYNCLQLKVEAVSQLVSEVVDISQFELAPHFGLADPLIEQILYQFAKPIDSSHAFDRLYFESLINTLVVHLLQHYATRKSAPPQPGIGLSQAQLKRVIDYIQTHLDQEIKLADIAQLLSMSQYHFCRLFRTSMGIPPYQYVLAQRVERAKALLRLPQHKSIADVALACGFSNQSHLCKQFRKLTGQTPRAYRQGL